MNADWKPGYSTIKTLYPYYRVESLVVFPNRPEFNQGEDGRVFVNIEQSKYPEQFARIFKEGISETEKIMHLNDFLLDRGLDFQRALNMCEEQVMELLSEDPFIPEQFGFELIHSPKTIDESPIRVYGSKYDDRYMIHRPVRDTLDKSWDPSEWVLQKNENGTITSETIKIPCHRIAYAFFYAKGIQVMPKKEDEIVKDYIIEEVKNEDLEKPEDPEYRINPPKGYNNYTVVFDREGHERLMIRDIISEDEKDAQTRAKLIIETDESWPGPEIDFIELTPILKISNK